MITNEREDSSNGNENGHGSAARGQGDKLLHVKHVGDERKFHRLAILLYL
jgi:hypothetical protein